VTSVSSVQQPPKLLLLFLFAGGLINYMDRAVIGLLGPAMRADLGLTAGQFGVAMSAFSLGYTLFTLVGGIATDRYGPARVLLATMVVWSFFAGLTGLVTTMATLVVARFMFGIGEAPWLSASNKVLIDNVPQERFSTFHSLCSSGQPLGGAIAGPVVGIVTAAFGWRAGFVTVGLVGLTWALFWYLIAFGNMRRSERAQSGLVLDPSYVNDAAGLEQSVSRRQLMRNPMIWVSIFAFSTATYLMFFFFSWFPSYLSERFHLTDRQLGLASAAPWLVGVLGYATGGMISDWLARRIGSLLQARTLMMTLCLFGSGLLTIAVPASHTLEKAMIFMSTAMGLMFMTGSMYFAIGLAVAPRRLVGFVSGVFLFCSNLAGTASPALSGYLIDWTGAYDTSFQVAGVLVIAAAAAGFFVMRREAL
jgi:ACS family hexuronate transporter-like MFS transporter